MPYAPAPTSSRLNRIGRAAAALLLWPARVAAARAVLTQVAGMSACELRDIGLSHQDVCDATALPLSADPGRLFSDRARERSKARRFPTTAPDAPPTAPDLPDERRRSLRPRRPALVPLSLR